MADGPQWGTAPYQHPTTPDGAGDRSPEVGAPPPRERAGGGVGLRGPWGPLAAGTAVAAGLGWLYFGLIAPSVSAGAPGGQDSNAVPSPSTSTAEPVSYLRQDPSVDEVEVFSTAQELAHQDRVILRPEKLVRFGDPAAEGEGLDSDREFLALLPASRTDCRPERVEVRETATTITVSLIGHDRTAETRRVQAGEDATPPPGQGPGSIVLCESQADPLEPEFLNWPIEAHIVLARRVGDRTVVDHGTGRPIPPAPNR